MNPELRLPTAQSPPMTSAPRAVGPGHDDVRARSRRRWGRLVLAPAVAELERRGHRAVPVELPVADESAGLAAYADTVVAATATGLPASCWSPSRWAGSPRPWSATGCRWTCSCSSTRWSRGPVRPAATGGRSPARGGAGRLPPGAASPATPTTTRHVLPRRPADVTAAAKQQPFAQSGRPFEDPWPLERWPDVPTRVVAGRDDRLFPLEFQRRVAADRLGLDVDEMPGGHLLALSRPVELADRLEAYLR